MANGAYLNQKARSRRICSEKTSITIETKVTNKVDAVQANDIVVEYGYDDKGTASAGKHPVSVTGRRVCHQESPIAKLVTGIC